MKALCHALAVIGVVAVRPNPCTRALATRFVNDKGIRLYVFECKINARNPRDIVQTKGQAVVSTGRLNGDIERLQSPELVQLRSLKTVHHGRNDKKSRKAQGNAKDNDHARGPLPLAFGECIFQSRPQNEHQNPLIKGILSYRPFCCLLCNRHWRQVFQNRTAS